MSNLDAAKAALGLTDDNNSGASSRRSTNSTPNTRTASSSRSVSASAAARRAPTNDRFSSITDNNNSRLLRMSDQSDRSDVSGERSSILGSGSGSASGSKTSRGGSSKRSHTSKHSFIHDLSATARQAARRYGPTTTDYFEQGSEDSLDDIMSRRSAERSARGGGRGGRGSGSSRNSIATNSRTANSSGIYSSSHNTYNTYTSKSMVPSAAPSMPPISSLSSRVHSIHNSKRLSVHSTDDTLDEGSELDSFTASVVKPYSVVSGRSRTTRASSSAYDTRADSASRISSNWSSASKLTDSRGLMDSKGTDLGTTGNTSTWNAYESKLAYNESIRDNYISDTTLGGGSSSGIQTNPGNYFDAEANENNKDGMTALSQQFETNVGGILQSSFDSNRMNSSQNMLMSIQEDGHNSLLDQNEDSIPIFDYPDPESLASSASEFIQHHEGGQNHASSSQSITSYNSQHSFIPQRFSEFRSLLSAITPLQLEALILELFDNTNPPKEWTDTASKSKMLNYRCNAYLSEMDLGELQRFTSDKNTTSSSSSGSSNNMMGAVVNECETVEEALDVIAVEFERLVSRHEQHIINGEEEEEEESQQPTSLHDDNDDDGSSQQGSSSYQHHSYNESDPQSNYGQQQQQQHDYNVQQTHTASSKVLHDETTSNLRKSLRACSLPELRLVANRLNLNHERCQREDNKEMLIRMIELSMPDLSVGTGGSVSSVEERSIVSVQQMQQQQRQQHNPNNNNDDDDDMQQQRRWHDRESEYYQENQHQNNNQQQGYENEQYDKEGRPIPPQEYNHGTTIEDDPNNNYDDDDEEEDRNNRRVKFSSNCKQDTSHLIPQREKNVGSWQSYVTLAEKNGGNDPNYPNGNNLQEQQEGYYDEQGNYIVDNAQQQQQQLRLMNGDNDGYYDNDDEYYNEQYDAQQQRQGGGKRRRRLPPMPNFLSKIIPSNNLLPSAGINCPDLPCTGNWMKVFGALLLIGLVVGLSVGLTSGKGGGDAPDLLMPDSWGSDFGGTSFGDEPSGGDGGDGSSSSNNEEMIPTVMPTLSPTVKVKEYGSHNAGGGGGDVPSFLSLWGSDESTGTNVPTILDIAADDGGSILDNFGLSDQQGANNNLETPQNYCGSSEEEMKVTCSTSAPTCNDGDDPCPAGMFCFGFVVCENGASSDNAQEEEDVVSFSLSTPSPVTPVPTENWGEPIDNNPNPTQQPVTPMPITPAPTERLEDTPQPTETYPLRGPFEEPNMRLILYNIGSLSHMGKTQWRMLTAAYVEQFFNTEGKDGADAIQNIVFDVVSEIELLGVEMLPSRRRTRGRRLYQHGGTTSARSNRELQEAAESWLQYKTLGIKGVILTFHMTISYRTFSPNIQPDTVAERPFYNVEIRKGYVDFLIANNAMAHMGDVNFVSPIFREGESLPELPAELLPTPSPVITSPTGMQWLPAPPSDTPTNRPTNQPVTPMPVTPSPTEPDDTPMPSNKPTKRVTPRPTPFPTDIELEESDMPSKRPTPEPTTAKPSKRPSPFPTSAEDTPMPSKEPSRRPTNKPSKRPTPNPTQAEVITARPTIPRDTPDTYYPTPSALLNSLYPTPDDMTTFQSKVILEPAVSKTFSTAAMVVQPEPSPRPSPSPRRQRTPPPTPEPTDEPSKSPSVSPTTESPTIYCKAPVNEPICPFLTETECCRPMCSWNAAIGSCSFLHGANDNEVEWLGEIEIGQTHVVKAENERRHAPRIIAHREAELLFTPAGSGGGNTRRLGVSHAKNNGAKTKTKQKPKVSVPTFATGPQQIQSMGTVYLVSSQSTQPLIDDAAQSLINGSEDIFSISNDIFDIDIIIDLNVLRLVEGVSMILHGDTTLRCARLGMHYDDGRNQEEEEEEDFHLPESDWFWLDFAPPNIEGLEDKIEITIPKRQARYVMIRVEGGHSESGHNWGFGQIKIVGSKDGLIPSDVDSTPQDGNAVGAISILPITRSISFPTLTKTRPFIPSSTASVHVAVFSSTGKLIGVTYARDPSKQRDILERRLSLLQIQDYSDDIWSVTLPYNWVDEGNYVLIGTIDEELLVKRLDLVNLAQFSEHTITRTKIAIFGSKAELAQLDSSTHNARRLVRNLYGVMPVAELKWADTDLWHLPYIVVMGKDGPARVNSEKERRGATRTGDEISWVVMKNFLTLRHSLAQIGLGLSKTSQEGANSPYASGTSVVMGWSLSKENEDENRWEWEDLGYWDTLAAAAWTGWCAMKAGDECSNYFVHEIGHAQTMQHFDEGTASSWGIEDEYPQDGKHMAHHPWGYDSVARQFRTWFDPFQGDGKLDPLNGPGEGPTSDQCFSQYTPYQAKKSQEWALATPTLLSASSSDVPIDGAYKFNSATKSYSPLEGDALTDAVGEAAMQPDQVGVPVVTLIGTIGKDPGICQTYPALRSSSGNTFDFPDPFTPGLPSAFNGAAHFVEIKYLGGRIERALIAVEKDLASKSLNFYSFNVAIERRPTAVSLYRFTEASYPNLTTQSATELLHLRPIELPEGNPLSGLPPVLRVGRGRLGESSDIFLKRFCESAEDCKSNEFNVKWRGDVGSDRIVYKSSLEADLRVLLGSNIFEIPVKREYDPDEYTITVLATRYYDDGMGASPLFKTNPASENDGSSSIDSTHGIRIVAPWEMNSSLPPGKYHSIEALKLFAEAVADSGNYRLIDFDVSLDLGTVTEAPTRAPTKKPTPGPSKSPIQVRYYIDWNTFTCVTDGESTQWAPPHVSLEDCCNYHMAYDFASCIKGGDDWHNIMGNSLPSGRDIKGDDDSGWLFNVLEFCDRDTRSNCLFLTKRHHKILSSDSSFRWRLDRLHIENGLYFPEELFEHSSWRTMYLELDKKRHLWDADAITAQDEAEGKYNISVYARFKPLSADSESHQSRQIVQLPLHQRLALIRIDKGLTSNQEALRVLKEQGGWFRERWDELEKGPAADDGADQDVDQPELTSGIKLIDESNARVVVVDSTKGLREFDFDGVMKDDIQQKDAYDSTTRGLVSDVINGISATCLVYGQTGSGKTFTMFGASEGGLGSSPSFSGIVPRACTELMEAVKYRKEALNLNIECTVSVSFVEVYGNDILDLLKRGRRCGHSKVTAQRSVLDGNAEVKVESIGDVMNLLSKGEAQKRKAATAMNARSSRAHSVFIVTLKQKCHDSGKTINSKLFLADLGGCEQTKKSKLEAGKSKHIDAMKESSANNELTIELADAERTKDGAGFVKSDRMREAVQINLGLMSLKSCVEALIQKKHVPYANSKLTMLLASGLGGNSKTSVIVCASQEEQHSSETINAFKFGHSCRNVSNSVRTNADMLGDLMKELDGDIASCEERIRKNERWVVQETKRSDINAEEGTLEAQGFGGVEVRKTTVLVGAEEDRKLLHSLLLKKSQLSGSKHCGNESTSMGHRFGGNIAFGNAHEYGLGDKFSLDEDKENYRFKEAPQGEFVPKSVHLGDSSKNKSAYMGISA